MMEGEGRGKRLAATACAFTLLFCLAVGLGVHGAFQYPVSYTHLTLPTKA